MAFPNDKHTVHNLTFLAVGANPSLKAVARVAVRMRYACSAILARVALTRWHIGSYNNMSITFISTRYSTGNNCTDE